MTNKRTEITKKKLYETLQRAVKVALLEASDSGVGKYAEQVDKLVEDQISELGKLIETGENLTQDSPTHDYAVQERNHLIMSRVGILKGLRARLIAVLEDLYRNV